MASPDILDFDLLLRPISTDQPGGEDLRKDISPTSPYYSIRDAREAARRQEREVLDRLEDEDDTSYFNRCLLHLNKSLSDWRRVDEQARTILAERSKNLQVTAWLIEALLRFKGFAGLRDGFRLARELVNKFWEVLYPLPDEEGVVTRVAPLSGLFEHDNAMIIPIYRVPLTQGNSVLPVTYLHYQRHTLEQDAAARDKHKDLMDKAAIETDAEFFNCLRQNLEQCQSEFTCLCEALREQCGEKAPASSRILDALANCREALRDLSKESEQQELSQQSAPPETAQVDEERQASPVSMASREEAFRTLLQVANYFRRCEPHSPISYLLEQAVRWGRMTLPELLGELILEEKARQEYCKLTGIRLDSEKRP